MNTTISPNLQSPGRRFQYQPSKEPISKFTGDNASIVPDDIALDYFLSLCRIVVERQFFYCDPNEDSRCLLINNLNVIKCENPTESPSFFGALRIKILATYNNKMPKEISEVFREVGVECFGQAGDLRY